MDHSTAVVKEIDARLGTIKAEMGRLEAARTALRPTETPNGKRRGRPRKNAVRQVASAGGR